MPIHQKSCSCNIEHPSSVDFSSPSDIRNRYTEAISSCDCIKLMVVGNDKYVNRANEIAFCKNSWKDLLDGRVSGRYLLCALGVNFQRAVKMYESPVELFCELARRGIIFINQKNISSNPYVEVIVNKGSPKILLLCGGPAIERAIFLSKKFGVAEIYRVIPAIHPDIKNSVSDKFSELFEKKRRQIWRDCWGGCGKAIDYMKGNISSSLSAGNILNDINGILSVTSSC